MATPPSPGKWPPAFGPFGFAVFQVASYGVLQLDEVRKKERAMCNYAFRPLEDIPRMLPETGFVDAVWKRKKGPNLDIQVAARWAAKLWNALPRNVCRPSDAKVPMCMTWWLWKLVGRANTLLL